MHIHKIEIQNYRLLKKSMLDLRENLSMIIGRNNTGKTSLLTIFDNFFKGKNFEYNDFSICLREEINNISNDTRTELISIKLILEIAYDNEEDFSFLSEFIMDLDPEVNKANICFECSINKDKLIHDINSNPEIDKSKYIRKYLSQYLIYTVWVFDNEDDLINNRGLLVKKELSDVKKLIDFDIIYAKRNVTSSEERSGKKVLSSLTTQYYNSTRDSDVQKFELLNSAIEDMDKSLEKQYDVFFETFLKNAKSFLDMDTVNVISNLSASQILNDSSEVVYGNNEQNLPEYYNGLGYMNILYLILKIEIKVAEFNKNKKAIKLFFIEEPEAHTHPQLQYVFADKIKSLLNKVDNLQTLITTHSPHIVSKSDFEDIRYMKQIEENIEILNFHKDLSQLYNKEEDHFKFLNQYLSIESTELFFAGKVILIEGITEKMLLPYYVKILDDEKIAKNKENIKKYEDYVDKVKKGIDGLEEIPQINEYIPISSQNISVLQVGANAKAFKHFLDFLNIKTLIITDIDTVKRVTSDSGKITYNACEVISTETISTSNATIKYYYNAPELNKETEHKKWIEKIIRQSASNNISENINVKYQCEENGYHARSFEDAFIKVNFDKIKNILQEHENDSKSFNIDGLKKVGCILKGEERDVYNITKDILDDKTDFSSSLLFAIHTNKVDGWNIPKYIKEGLEWLQK